MKVKELRKLLEGMKDDEEIHVRDDVYGLVPVMDIVISDNLVVDSENRTVTFEKVWCIVP